MMFIHSRAEHETMNHVDLLLCVCVASRGGGANSEAHPHSNTHTLGAGDSLTLRPYLSPI